MPGAGKKLTHFDAEGDEAITYEITARKTFFTTGERMALIEDPANIIDVIPFCQEQTSRRCARDRVMLLACTTCEIYVLVRLQLMKLYSALDKHQKNTIEQLS